MADRQVKVRLIASVAEYQRDLARASLATKRLSTDMSAVANTKGMAKPARDVDALAKASEKAATAASKLKEAELRAVAAQEKLNAVRETGKASASQLATAEAGLVSAERKVAAAQQDSADAASALQTGVSDAASALDAQRQAMVDVGQAAAIMGGAIGAGLAIAANAAMGWETAWAGVTKTVDGSSAQMEALETDLRELAKALPSTHEEIAAVAEAAGQLGVKRDAIAGFTKVMIDLGETTNLTAEDAATAIAQIANVMGTAPPEVERLGAALVALGNDGASTEADILDMAQRLAGAAKLIGASESDVLALANAMSSLGIESELGGGAMSRSILTMYGAVKSGGAELDRFAKIAGTSAADFAAAFESDPVRAIDAFLQGLNRIDSTGGNVVQALDDVGLSGTQNAQVLLRLKGAGDLLTRSLDLGAKAWDANTALIDEANKRYATTESQIAVAKNAVHDLGIELGAVLLPAITSSANGVADLASWFGDLPDPLKSAFVALATLTATVGLLGGAALMAVGKLAALEANLIALGVSANGAAIATARLSAVLKGAALASVLAGVAFAAFSLADALAAPPPKLDALSVSLRKFAVEGATSGELLKVVGEDFSEFANVLDKANNSKGWTNPFGSGSLGSFFDLDFSDTGQKVKEAQDKIEALDQALAGLVRSGHADEAKQAYERIAEAALKGADGEEELQARTEELTSRFSNYSAAAAAAAEQTGVTGDSADGLRQQMDDAAAAVAGTAGEIEELTDAQKALETALGTFVNPLKAYADEVQKSAERSAEAHNKGVEKQITATRRDFDARIEAARRGRDATADQMKTDADAAAAAERASGRKVKATVGEKDARRDATRDLKNSTKDTIQSLEDQRDATLDRLGEQKKTWEDYADTVKVNLGEVAKQLEADIKAHEQWEANLGVVAQRAGQDVAQILAEMGEEGVGYVAAMADGSDAEVKRMATALRRGAEIAGEGAALALEDKLKVMAAIGAAGAKATAQGIAVALAMGVEDVARIAKEYGVKLAVGVNPLLTALGRKPAPVATGVRTPGEQFAAGGPVWGAGTATSDSIPALLSNGEYVIKASSVQKYGQGFLDDVNQARYADGGRVRRFATGGFASERDVPAPPSTSPYGPPISTAGSLTMARAHGDTVDFVRAYAAPQLTAGIGFQAMMAALHTAFPGLQLISGFRPGAITATGNRSYHAQGRAVDLPPRLDVNRWIAEHYGNATRELILSLPGAVNLHNGRPHRYGEPTYSMHKDHNHWAMAKGGLFNPHVRDQGGPLMPGYTFNGTGSPEMVLPMAAGGIVTPRSPLRRGETLSGAASRLTTPDAVRALVDAWDRYAEAVDRARERAELLADVTDARRDYERAKGIQARTSALESLKNAQATLSRFDQESSRQRETAAVDAVIARLEKLTDARERAKEAAEEAARKQAEAAELAIAREENLYAVGAISTQQHLVNLARRINAEQEYSDEWTSLMLERQRILDEAASTEKQRLAELADAEQRRLDQQRQHLEDTRQALSATQQVQTDAAARLGALLDQQQAVGDRQLAATRQHQADRARLEEREVQATRTHAQALLAAQQDLAEQQQTLLDERTAALSNATGLDQLGQFNRGLPTGWLLGNARAQIDTLEQWMAELATARQAGVSEAVIGALGLDQGPESLYQLRELNRSTTDEIVELNEIVSRRTQVAAQQAQREQASSLGDLGQALTAAQQEYAATVADLQAAHQAEQATLAAELAELQATFLAEQQQLAAELSALGVDQGRSYGDALAQGLMSSLPGVQAAAAALSAAMAGTAAAEAGAKLGLRPQTGDQARFANEAAVQAVMEANNLRTASFDSGGWLKPGYTLAYNGTGVPERVLTARQSAGAAAHGGLAPNVTVNAVIRETIDVDLVVRRAEFLATAGAF